MTDKEIISSKSPENKETRIVFNIPNLDELWENLRGRQGEILISKTQISDQLFEFEETKLVISFNSGGYSRLGFITTFEHSKEKLLKDSGFYHNDYPRTYFDLGGKRGLIAQNIYKYIHAEKNNSPFRNLSIIGDRYSDEEYPDQSLLGFHLMISDYDCRAVIRLGPGDIESGKEEKVREWKEKNIPPKKGQLSNREYEPLYNAYQTKLQEYIKGLGYLTNRSICLDASKGTHIDNQYTFNELLHNFTKAYQTTLEAIYEAEGFPVPDLKINFAIPKMPKSENPVEIIQATKGKTANIVNKTESVCEGFETIAGQEIAVSEAKKLVTAIKNPEIYQKRGVKIPKGILFYGPPGTGKTMIARAIAEESGAKFIEVSVADIGSKWHGESEKMLQQIFDNAGSNGKTILFFDEFDSFAPPRDDSYEITRKLIAVFNQNMDGLKSNPDVTVIAATNRPEGVDLAAKRSGRFDKIIEMGLPDEKGRVAILQKHIEKAKQNSSESGVLFSTLDFNMIGQATNGLSGADLANLINRTLETKLEQELEGKEWSPINTNEVLDMAQKLILERTEKVQVGFAKKT